MSQFELEPIKRRRFSLSVRVSMGLVLVAIIPLMITVVFSVLQTAPALGDQANKSMASDARTRVQLIETYLKERSLDVQTLGQVTSVQQFMATPLAPDTPGYQDLATHALYALAAGAFRDKNYGTWTFFDQQNRLRLYYALPPNPSTPPKPHGQYMVPPEYKQAVAAGNSFISAVYYSPDTQKATVDIYSPIVAPQTKQYLGCIRATLKLDYIWNIIREEAGNNGAGSYAFILDENGVRIADTDPARRFKGVMPLPQDIQQRISNEARYGDTKPVALLADSVLANTMRDTASTTLFQSQPSGQTEPFQIVRQKITIVPWNYYVLSPVTTISAVVNRLLISIGVIAATMSLLVAIVGLIVGRSITRPILTSVEYLRNNSQALSALASSQQDAASEQMWVVDSSQVGLQSVQYYTDATKVAARQLTQLGTDLSQRWGMIDAHSAKQALEHMVAAAQYIENATQYQDASNQKLSTALKVATQVTEQLATGATSATDAATQLEHVVGQLRSVVGR